MTEKFFSRVQLGSEVPGPHGQFLISQCRFWVLEDIGRMWGDYLNKHPLSHWTVAVRLLSKNSHRLPWASRTPFVIIREVQKQGFTMSQCRFIMEVSFHVATWQRMGCNGVGVVVAAAATHFNWMKI